jgi:pimeloyl-ACP methyl ester carboxylesterase
VPLLLVPAFPLTNLSLVPLLKHLTEPEEGEQAFHVVAPSVPGLGFSDAFMFSSTFSPEGGVAENVSEGVLASTVDLLDVLMQKLQYSSYLCSSTGSGIASPANIDYHIPRLLAQSHGDRCLGIHMIDAPIPEPSLVSAPLAWIKFGIAKFFHAPIFGYVKEDWRALTGSIPPAAPIQEPEAETEPDLEAGTAAPASTISAGQKSASKPIPGSTATNLGLSSGNFGPNTFAYALCDSPVGLLSLVLAGLRHLSPSHTLTQTEIINITQLAWLPGPEAAMRFWGSATAENAAMSSKQTRSKTATALTTFLGVAAAGAYKPPGWAAASHNVVYSTRHEGSAGLLVWERGSVIIDGVRGLAKAVVKTHPELVSLVPVEMTGVTIDEEGEAEAQMTNINVITDIDDVQQMDVESPDTVVLAREL